MSSAILYLAIVAIWAVVLVPRWLRPRMAEPEFAEQPGEPQSAATEPAESAPAGDADWPDPAPEDGPAWAAGEESPGEPEEPDTALLSPAQQRDSIVQARRRMLGTLAALTAGAVGLAVTGITGYWVIIPPVVLLAGFLVLLREAGHAGAKRDQRATWIRDADVSPLAGQEPALSLDDAEAGRYRVPAAAGLAAGPAPGADVIDISARVSDQVYDQYADAVERAVGD